MIHEDGHARDPRVASRNPCHATREPTISIEAAPGGRGDKASDDHAAAMRAHQVRTCLAHCLGLAHFPPRRLPMPSLLCRICTGTELGGGITGQRLMLKCEENFQHGEFGMHRVRAQRDDSAAPTPVRSPHAHLKRNHDAFCVPLPPALKPDLFAPDARAPYPLCLLTSGCASSTPWQSQNARVRRHCASRAPFRGARQRGCSSRGSMRVHHVFFAPWPLQGARATPAHG